MKSIIVVMLMLLSFEASAQTQIIPDVITVPAKKLITPDWLKTKALKWGVVGSFCVYQGLTGLSEAHRFAQADTYLISEGNYHTFATAQRGMGIVTGWFGYALYRTGRFTKWEKARLAAGALLWGRNVMEMDYKYGRYGNPFDYTEEHNRHSLVYFGIQDGKITDMYISTGPVSGPIVDITFWVLGALFIGSV